MESTVIQLPPFSIQIDDCEATVLEVLKTSLVGGVTWYHVVVQLNYKGVKSRRFTLDVKDEKHLINRLKSEVTKLKFIEYASGLAEVKRLIT
jgi:hypothetical protein